MGPWVLPAPCCAAELARIPCSFAGLDQCQLPLHMHCDLEFYLFFLFRLLLKDYFGACSINACLWCLLIWLCGPCAGFEFGAWSRKLSLCTKCCCSTTLVWILGWFWCWIWMCCLLLHYDWWLYQVLMNHKQVLCKFWCIANHFCFSEIKFFWNFIF